LSLRPSGREESVEVPDGNTNMTAEVMEGDPALLNKTSNEPFVNAEVFSRLLHRERRSVQHATLP
jgi:hypothetical protein